MPDDWITYERSRLRTELTRISRFLSATVRRGPPEPLVQEAVMGPTDTESRVSASRGRQASAMALGSQ
ncbi:hypothetical protein GCM10022419_080590 [Nonomuraea rosea]|uniref:Uncharacterized protein n=1 Tax=Nonomuraea rosea TaxID=638574 RepID=A0ABP6YMH9_9ACTN